MPEEQNMKEVQPQGVGQNFEAGADQDPAVVDLQQKVRKASEEFTARSLPKDPSKRELLKVGLLAATAAFLSGCEKLPFIESAALDEAERHRPEDDRYARTQIKALLDSTLNPNLEPNRHGVEDWYIDWSVRSAMESIRGERVPTKEFAVINGYDSFEGKPLLVAVPDIGQMYLRAVRATINHQIAPEGKPTRGILHSRGYDSQYIPPAVLESGRINLGPVDHSQLRLFLNSSARLPRLSLGREEVQILRSKFDLAPEEFTAAASEQRRIIIGAARTIIEKAVKLPAKTNWLPELGLEGWQAFGQFPNGDRLYITLRAAEDYGKHTWAAVYIVDTQSDFLPPDVLGGTFEAAAKKQIETMDKENVIHKAQDWTPYPATEDLNKIRQELGL